MPSELDLRFEAIMNAITAPDGLVPAARDAEGRAYVPSFPDNLADYFRYFLALHGDKEAVVAGDERLSYADLETRSERLARVLVGQYGIRKGDRVAIAMRNCPAWIVSYIAAVKAGAIATLVNGWWTSEELAYGLTLTAPALVIADVERARRIAEAGIEAKIVALPIERPIDAALAPLTDGAAEGDPPKVLPEDDATILFTSGSTGKCKGAVATHRAVTTGAYTFLCVTATLLTQFHGGDRANLPSPPAILIAVPLFHVTGEVPVFLTSVAIERRMVLMRKWDPGEALRLIERERISYFIGVPTMSLELMQHPDRDQFDTTSLLDIVAGGAARPVAHVPRLAAAFPRSNPMMGYGLTETSAVGCTNYRGNYIAKPASTGRAQAPFVEIDMFDEKGDHVPQGGIGEIGIRAAANIRGYWNDPKASEAAFTTDGYFLTGDLGYLDEDDYVFIVDRAKDVIIRGGENISCLEVESALYAHPAIAEASVFGLPDERLGEVPGAAVHLEPGERIDAGELRAFLALRLAKFKLPERLWVWDEPLPKLGTGKIDKKALRAHYNKAAPAAPDTAEKLA